MLASLGSSALPLEKNGDFRGSNPGPLAPKARIIPLDQNPSCFLQGIDFYNNGTVFNVRELTEHNIIRKMKSNVSFILQDMSLTIFV